MNYLKVILTILLKRLTNTVVGFGCIMVGFGCFVLGFACFVLGFRVLFCLILLNRQLISSNTLDFTRCYA